MTDDDAPKADWTAQHFSQANPSGRGQEEIPLAPKWLIIVVTVPAGAVLNVYGFLRGKRGPLRWTAVMWMLGGLLLVGIGLDELVLVLVGHR